MAEGVDISELTKLEIDIIKVAGSSANVWTLEDFRKALVKNGINKFNDPPDLPNFLRKRPHIFSYKMDHVWSKFDNVDNLVYKKEEKVTNTKGNTNRKITPQKEPEMKRKLFLGYLNNSTTEEGIKKHFEKYGKIVDCVVMKFPETKKSRGFGFVTFENSSQTTAALDDGPHIIDKFEVEVKKVVPKEEVMKQKSRNCEIVDDETRRKLFIGGLSYHTTDDTFYDYFAQFGELVDWVVMKYPPDFERSRGFGFVTYKDVKMMEKCLKQNPHFIDDFQVEARRAVARENVGHDYDPDWDDADEPTYEGKESEPVSVRTGVIRVTSPRFDEEQKHVTTSKYQKEKYQPPRMLKKFEDYSHVIETIKNNTNDSTNSIRTTVLSRKKVQHAILFKMDWIYSQVKDQWQIEKHEMIESLKRSSKKQDDIFVLGENSFHVQEYLQKVPVLDMVARVIVEILFESHNVDTIANIFEKLSLPVQKYLKSTEGLTCFIGFYPELFIYIPSQGLLMLNFLESDANTKSQAPPLSCNVDSIESAEVGSVKALWHLMNMAYNEVENSIVYVEENVDRPLYSIAWLWQKLPVNIQRFFKNDKVLQKFMFKYPQMFRVHGQYAQNMEKIKHCPSEKTVSLEILKILRENPDASLMDIAKRLPSPCRLRIRTAKELTKFLALHEDFHENWHSMNEKYGEKDNDKLEYVTEALNKVVVGENDEEHKIMSPMLENNEVNFTINDDDSDEVTTWRFTKNLGWKKYNEFSEVVGEQSIVVENDPKPFHWVDKEIEKLKVQLGNLQQCLDVNSLKESSVMAREISDKIELLHKATRFAQFEESFSALAPSDMMMNEHDILVEA